MNTTKNEEQPDVLDVRGQNPHVVQPGGVQDTPEIVSRRKFLNKLSVALGGIGGAIVAVPVAAFIVAPLFVQPPEIWRSVGVVDNFKVGTTEQVSFEDASPLPWAGVTARTAAWLRRDSETEFRAFAVNCSHLGCPVSWVAGAGIFMCPCHGGVYYQDGTVAAGPPPQALSQYPIRIRDGQVELKATGTPIPTE